MNTAMNAALILNYRERRGGPMLLVDDHGVAESGIARLSEMGISPTELWVGDHRLRGVAGAVVSKPRPARELYRVLANLERFILPGGSILILPYATEAGPENRFEATEIFLGVYPEWERNLVDDAVVELRKMGGASVGTHAKGARKRVVSLAVFGTGGYWAFLPAFVRAHAALFPTYELRVHHDDNLDRMPYGQVLRALAARKIVTLMKMPCRDGEGKCEKMLWRLVPAWDPTVEYVFCRDADSLPMWRDRAAVEEFVASGRDTHTIHDAEAHCGIMGGLCGFRAEALRRLHPTYEAFVRAASYSDQRWAQHGADQDYLNSMVRPYMTALGHSLRVKGHNRDAAMGPIEYVTEIAEPPVDAVDSVPRAAREQSDALAPYLGSAGCFSVKDVVNFYDKSCAEAVAEIIATEREIGYAGESEPEIPR